MKKTAIMIVAASMAVATAAWALPLDLSSGRVYFSQTPGTGLFATENWANGGTWIDWNITQVANGWSYTYQWHTDSKNLSHLILEVTPGSSIDEFAFGDSSYAPGADDLRWYSPSDPGDSNPGLPANIYGFKVTPGIDTTDFTFSFVTSHNPVWGDFYARDGKNRGRDVIAYNAGFNPGNAGSGNSLGGYIAVPNGPPTRAVPDGAMTVALLGLSLGSIGMIRRGRRA
jgi:hypothetical protein